MYSQKTGKSPLREAYNLTFRCIKNNPAIFFPFIIFAVFDFIATIIIYLAPRAPLRAILGPPIRTLWGERFLHYPLNFILLPKLASLSRMVLTICVGSLLTGIAVAMILNVYNKKHINLIACLRSSFKKYIHLFAVVLFFSSLYFILIRIIRKALIMYFISGHSKLLFLEAGIWMGPLLLVLSFVFAILIQSAFIYAIPVLIIERQRLVKSIVKSFITFKRMFFSTITLVGLPMLFYIPFIILQYKSVFLINKLFPEFVLLVSLLYVIVNALIIDILVTTSITFLYLITTHEKTDE